MAVATSTAGPRPRSAGAALGAAALGLVLAGLLYRFPPPLGLSVVGGVAMIGVLALAIARYHAAVALAFALLGVVVVEPAPSDGVFLVLMAIALVGRRFRLAAVPLPVIVALGMLAAFNLLSAVQVADPERAASYFLISAFVASVAVWLTGYVVTRGRARLVVRAYLVAAVSSAILGLLGLFAPVPGAEMLAEGGRARALFQDPNVFGPFLIPALLIVIEELLHPRLLSARMPTKGLIAGVLTLGVLFSYSRGAWLNLGVAVLVMVAVLSLRRGGSRRVLGLVAIAGVAAAVVVATVVVTGSGDFLAERAQPQAYDQQRFSGQRAGLEPALQYPFGAGPGQFESIAQISAHSTYARVLGEQGFPGLFVLLALLAFTLGAAVRNAVLGRGTYGIGSVALLGAWCGLLVNSFVVDTLHWRHLWIVAALIWAGSMRRYRQVTPLRVRAAGEAPTE
ncbi:MAG TPA: O-antigen ligase family protein [Solirubrobacteraceae bacterium]|nr:O-antigen ligase family protein [Solirubrobacteraceae bacterium]